ncbi:DUF4249 family protein [Natronogracilivirga saccharolytica]|uniref:DUF4249 family protein n=1 Tax=Natronogracilivirga saccharolytica TaxID=2812953 RepID=A0A8J7SD04_9BACT|nr:DUF4249 family protein [Natronogracilivirga saccharolytica]MBP3193796.1 DUF4249 family protein [Natronogracilivirga saccharolytica]
MKYPASIFQFEFYRSNIRFPLGPALLALLLTVAGCDLYGQDEYEEKYVVESYLIAHENMPQVNLSTTAPFGESYQFSERAVSEADVRIHRYNPDGERDRTYDYEEIRTGVYIPLQEQSFESVLPNHTYRLDIRIPDDNDHHIEAYSTVPDTFSVVEIIRDQSMYQSPQQLELRITRNRSGNRQNHFIFATEALDPKRENITPFWRDAIDDISEAVRIRTSIVNEENFDANPDGTLTLRLPWIGIAFFGENRISTFSIDDNTYDFFRSQSVQTGGGGGTLSPGEIQNIIYNIDGAIGLFGSMSGIEVEVTVDRPPFLRKTDPEKAGDHTDGLLRISSPFQGPEPWESSRER